MQNDFDINLNDYEKSQFINKGSFGEVFVIKSKANPKISYAAKISIITIKEDSSEGIDLTREINIMAKIHHPSILKFIGYSPLNFEKELKPVIVTEYLPNDSLDKLIDLSIKGLAPEKWDDTLKLITLYGIASAMTFLHKHNIIHRDLKPANILMDSYLHPKICDFGFSKEKNNEDQSSVSFKGTVLYSPPEIIEDGLYSEAGDVYSFAIIAYEIIMNEKPFSNDTSIFNIQRKVVSGERPKFNSYIEDSYRELIESCWSHNMDERPSFEEILNALKSNPDFITDMVDEDQFFDYVDFIDNEKSSYNPGYSINIFESKIEEEEDCENKKIAQEEQAPLDFPQNIYNKLSKQNKKFIKRALVDNNSSAQFNIGLNFLTGRYHFPKKADLGLKYIKMAVDNKNIKAFKFYCKKLIYGCAGIKKDLNQAREILNDYINDEDFNDSNKTDPEIYFLYGLLLIKEKDFEQAKVYLLKTKKSKFADPMFELGRIFFHEKDYKNARQYFDLAKKKGSIKKEPEFPENVDETYQRAMNYINGNNGCQINYPKAVSILKNSASKNHVPSLKELGKIYYKGYKKQIPVNYKESLSNFKKAASQGDCFSIKKVAYMYYYGLGVTCNHQTAAKYYKIASDKGDMKAILNYANLLMNGDGTKRDLDEACRYLRIGARKHDQDCINQLKEIQKQKNQEKFNDDDDDFDDVHSSNSEEEEVDDDVDDVFRIKDAKRSKTNTNSRNNLNKSKSAGYIRSDRRSKNSKGGRGNGRRTRPQ